MSTLSCITVMSQNSLKRIASVLIMRFHKTIQIQRFGCIDPMYWVFLFFFWVHMSKWNRFRWIIKIGGNFLIRGDITACVPSHFSHRSSTFSPSKCCDKTVRNENDESEVWGISIDRSLKHSILSREYLQDEPVLMFIVILRIVSRMRGECS